MMNRIEKMVNWYSDRNSTWWLLRRLRPERNELFSWKRTCLLITMDVVLAIGTLFVCFFIVLKIDPWLYILFIPKLGDPEFLIIAFVVVLSSLFMRLLMAAAWNRRARRLGLA